jgi:1-acyl-sn-glycerol-3-phosphate acyltransferase
MIYWITFVLTRIVSFFLFPVKCCGLQNVPPRGSCILAVNHVSNLDPEVIGIIICRKVNFLAKDSLFKNKIFGAYLRQLNVFPIKREAHDIGALREALKRLKSGMPLVMFPEGARAGSQSPFLKTGSAYAGIGFLAAKSGAPVIPIKISGSEKVLPPGDKWVHRSRVTVVLGSPLRFPPQEDYALIAQKIMDGIRSLEIPAG